MSTNWDALVYMVKEIKLCEKHSIPIASIAMSYIAIDAIANLSRPEDKERSTRSDFIEWVDEYLICHPDHEYKYRGKDVYAARCALLHTFSAEAEIHEKDPDILKFAYHNRGMHCLIPEVSPKMVLIDSQSFTNDLVKGIMEFMKECNRNPLLGGLVESRLDSVFNKLPIPSRNGEHADSPR